MTETPRDIANTPESWVLPLPQRVLAILLNGLFSNNAKPVLGCEDLSFLKQSAAYLEKEFKRAFEHASGVALPEPLAAARDEISTLLGDLNTRLVNAPSRGDQDAIEAFGETAKSKLAEAVGTFLGALFDAVVAHEMASSQRNCPSNPRLRSTRFAMSLPNATSLTAYPAVQRAVS